ncbi:MAG: methyl-accepting chemotaxis protein, partial [Caryophanon sp.]|nr:methyl-accepting chemotaxis protein [Caryophanon sp.]
GQVIATLQIGVGDSFLQNIEQALQGVAVHLVQKDNTVIRSTDEQMVGEVVDVTAALQGTIARDKNDTTFRSDLPIYDPSEQNIVAALRVEQNIIAAHENFRTLILTSVSIFVFTLLISTTIAIYYSHSVTKSIIFTATIARHVADKDLCHTPTIVKRKDEIGQLANSVIKLKDDLSNTLHTVQQSAISLSKKSIDLDAATNDISSGTVSVAEAMQIIAHSAEQQTSHIATITEHMQTFTQDVTTTAEESRTLQQLTTHAQTQSSEGARFMSDAQMKMQHMEQLMQHSITDLHTLQQQSTHISSFVAIIENVASETNLLALNASIEAARAGEHGKGFAIVADEVRKLAEQTAKSIDEITTLVSGIQQSTNTLQQSLQHGADETVATAHALQLTATSFSSIDTLITQIGRFVNDVQQQFTTMTGTSTSIQHSLEQMTGLTQETSAGIEETSATMQETSATMVQISVAAEQLAQLSQQLEQVVHQYKLPPM